MHTLAQPWTTAVIACPPGPDSTITTWQAESQRWYNVSRYHWSPRCFTAPILLASSAFSRRSKWLATKATFMKAHRWVYSTFSRKNSSKPPLTHLPFFPARATHAKRGNRLILQRCQIFGTTYAADNIIAKADIDKMNLKRLTVQSTYAPALWIEALRSRPVYDQFHVKRTFIEWIRQLIQQRLQSYWDKNQLALLQ